jgi:hypothetical protein
VLSKWIKKEKEQALHAEQELFAQYLVLRRH